MALPRDRRERNEGNALGAGSGKTPPIDAKENSATPPKHDGGAE